MERGGVKGGTRFHLIRHAEYALTGRVLGGRETGHALTDRGRAQAEALADTLGDLPIGAVACSPIERARETALPIAASLGLDVSVEPDLNEIDFGAWTGLPFEVLDDQPEWQAWNRFRSHGRPPGGESMAHAQARALGAVARLRAAHPEGEVVVVSHGDVIKAILAQALGLSLDLIRRFDIAPGSRSLLTLHDHDARVDALNLPSDARF